MQKDGVLARPAETTYLCIKTDTLYTEVANLQRMHRSLLSCEKYNNYFYKKHIVQYMCFVTNRVFHSTM